MIQVSAVCNIIQGSANPVFSGPPDVTDKFLCLRCRGILIDHYIAECYIDITIKCFSCGGLSTTADLPWGTIFSGARIKLDDPPPWYLGSTVRTDRNVVIASPSSERRFARRYHPRADSIGWSLSEGSLITLAARYESLTQSSIDDQWKIIKRCPPKFRDRYPFVWALEILERYVHGDSSAISQKELEAAVLWINSFNYLDYKWRFHPLYHIIGKGFAEPGKYFHTCGNLLAATLLAAHDNEINFSLENDADQPNPDLYMQGMIPGENRHHIEIKVPQKFLPLSTDIDSDEFFQQMRRSIRKSGRQIKSGMRGMLIIVSFRQLDRNWIRNDAGVVNLMNDSGITNSAVSAIALISLSDFAVDLQSAGGCNVQAGFSTHVWKNPGFAGRNPINTNARI